MIKVKPPIVYVISALMLAAAAFRGLIQAFELNNDYRWVIVGLLILYGALLFSEIAISRKFPHYLYYYFIIQASIVIILILLPLFPLDNPNNTDFFALLFIPLCVQVIFYTKRPANYYWVIALTIASVTALQIQYGFIQGIEFSITYIMAYAGISFLSILYVDLGLVHIESIDDAISFINSGQYGNMACLFTSNGASARKFRHETEAGNIGINIGVAAPMAYFPFSGWKDSFFGTLHGQANHAVEFFAQTKVVVERWPKEWSRQF